MFSNLKSLATEDEPDIVFNFEGAFVRARPGQSVAAALAACGYGPTRYAPRSGAPRFAYCMMGICFECLVTIDGVSDLQACLVAAKPGMQVTRTAVGIATE